jgi:ferredoxin
MRFYGDEAEGEPGSRLNCALASRFVALDIQINRELCMGSGNCSFWAPGVFDLDDDGIAIVLDPAAQPDDKIVLAAQGCPTQAIAVFRGAEKLV